MNDISRHVGLLVIENENDKNTLKASVCFHKQAATLLEKLSLQAHESGVR